MTSNNNIWSVFALVTSIGIAADAQASSLPECAGDPDVQTVIKRAIFTTKITDREPVDELSQIPDSADELFMFTDVRKGKDTRISHVWYERDKRVALANLRIGSSRWRTWSRVSSDRLSGKHIRVDLIHNEQCILLRRELPAVGEPTLQSHSSTEDSTTEDNTSESSIAEDSATEGSATEDSATEGSATEDSATEGSTTEDSATEGSTTEDSTTDASAGESEGQSDNTESTVSSRQRRKLSAVSYAERVGQAAQFYSDAQHAVLAGDFDGAEADMQSALETIPESSPSRDDIRDELMFRLPLLRLDDYILALDQTAAKRVYKGILAYIENHPNKKQMQARLAEYEVKIDAMN